MIHQTEWEFFLDFSALKIWDNEESKAENISPMKEIDMNVDSKTPTKAWRKKKDKNENSFMN